MEDRIKKVMSAVFEVSKIDKNSTINTIKSWDSLKHMNLIIALEDEFQVMIPDEKVADLISFFLIKKIIKELLDNEN